MEIRVDECIKRNQCLIWLFLLCCTFQLVPWRRLKYSPKYVGLQPIELSNLKTLHCQHGQDDFIPSRQAWNIYDVNTESYYWYHAHSTANLQ